MATPYQSTSEPPKESSKSSWVDWFNAALGAYTALKKPSYQQAPLSPEQKRIYELYINSLMNPDLKDLASRTSKSSQEILNGYQGVGWNSPTTFSGQFGYRGSRTPTTPTAVNNQLPPGQTPGRTIFDNSDRDGTAFGEGSQRREPFNRVWEPTGEFPFSPRSPQNDPNKEASIRNPLLGTNPTGQSGDMRQPTQFPPGGMQYGTPSDLLGFADFLRSQGVKDAARIAIGFLGGGYIGGAAASIKVLWDRYQNSKKGGG